ncbi:MAG: hypothetical protein NWE96_09770 [Candidatus Bathyarchaeota archaeon]|nr:hypothetical protein [Candidatus Bathyarchaeota archaeon]
MPAVYPDHFLHIFNQTRRRKKKKITILANINLLFEWLETKYPNLFRAKTGEFIEENQTSFPTPTLFGNLSWIFSREFSAVLLMTLGGAYDSAARTLRWMLETAVKAFIAFDDKSILTRKEGDRGQAMTFYEFLDFLEYTDSTSKRRKDKPLTNWIQDTAYVKKINKYKRIRGIGNLPDAIALTWLDGLMHGEMRGADLIYGTYEQLSSYIHTNYRAFRPACDLSPYVTFEAEEFEKIYQLSVQTADIVLYLLILGIWSDIGYYSPEMGEKFEEVVVKELTEDSANRKEQLDLFEALPSLRGLCFAPGRNYCKQIEDEQMRKTMKALIERSGKIHCVNCAKKDSCTRFKWLIEQFGAEGWFKEKLNKDSPIC